MLVNKPLISVIMPCFNAEPYLAEAIASVMGQTWQSVELLIVDDGSSDDSVAIAEDARSRHPDRIRLFRQSRQGPYPARNLGLREANGQYAAFLDADDWWTPDCLESLCDALSGTDAALAYCGWQNVGASFRSNEPFVPPDYEQLDKATAFLRAASPWPIHAALTRLDIIRQVGGFDTNWRSCMDYDLWLRIAVSRPIVLVPKVMAFYRHSVTGQITAKQWVQAETTWLVKKKFVASHPNEVAHLSAPELRELIDGGYLQRGFQAYWRRDLVTARHVFRSILKTGSWSMRDLRYLLPALLPLGLYQRLIGAADR
jgi:glycosyltransferase involved in cell wall biosynthesis